MKHFMKLKKAPFLMIESGKKTIELRLYDEKRQRISIGDEIEFSCVDGIERHLQRRVIALHIFASFADLYKTLPLLKCGYTEADLSSASPLDMAQYYSQEEQSRFGVVGIEIESI